MRRLKSYVHQISLSNKLFNSCIALLFLQFATKTTKVYTRLNVRRQNVFFNGKPVFNGKPNRIDYGKEKQCLQNDFGNDKMLSYLL